MIVTVKYFYKKTNEDCEEHYDLWDKNEDKMIYLCHTLPLEEQARRLIGEINENKDILALAFLRHRKRASHKSIIKNQIVSNILDGKGFVYDDNKIWYPKEVWISIYR